MSLTTLTFDTADHSNTVEYAAGRADAYDDARHTTLEALTARAAEYADHAPALVALGYMDSLLEQRMAHAACTAAETELAYADRTRSLS